MIDTFAGYPYSDGHPVHPKGKYGDVSKDKPEGYIKSVGLEDHIRLFEGKVEDIFETLGLKNISFAHSDCDLYIPIRFCAKKVPGITKPGGIIYFDDYGHEHCFGATLAVEEVFDVEQIHKVHMPEENTCWSGYIIV